MSKNKWEEPADKLEKIGKSMEGVGKKLTIIFTIPILLTFLFGIPGLIIGIIIAIVVLS